MVKHKWRFKTSVFVCLRHSPLYISGYPVYSPHAFPHHGVTEFVYTAIHLDEQFFPLHEFVQKHSVSFCHNRKF